MLQVIRAQYISCLADHGGLEEGSDGAGTAVPALVVEIHSPLCHHRAVGRDQGGDVGIGQPGEVIQVDRLPGAGGKVEFVRVGGGTGRELELQGDVLIRLPRVLHQHPGVELPPGVAFGKEPERGGSYRTR